MGDLAGSIHEIAGLHSGRARADVFLVLDHRAFSGSIQGRSVGGMGFGVCRSVAVEGSDGLALDRTALNGALGFRGERVAGEVLRVGFAGLLLLLFGLLANADIVVMVAANGASPFGLFVAGIVDGGRMDGPETLLDGGRTGGVDGEAGKRDKDRQRSLHEQSIAAPGTPHGKGTVSVCIAKTIGRV